MDSRETAGRTTASFLHPQPWILTTRELAVRLFLTCWAIYAVHVATNTVREIYPALAIGDHFSFRVDDYANMHPDLFEKPGYGWHIGANPGASMLGAIPYVLTRPLIDRIVRAVNRKRQASGQQEPPDYNSPWPMRRGFYKEAWLRGYDVKFGLAAIVMQWFCMAPICALGVVAMFYILRRVFGSDRSGFWLALLYAFGSPVFFRTGFLNHNMMLGHFAFMGFLAMWNPGVDFRWSEGQRFFLGGLAGGASVLLDYSGLVLLLGLFSYAIAKVWNPHSFKNVVRVAWVYSLGAIGPILLLWFYQWRSFGNPFLPGQHWMPPVQWIDVGYQGLTWPRPDLFWNLLFNYQYGLFLTCPLMLLALFYPWRKGTNPSPISAREMAVLILIPLALLIFCSGISYTRLQFNNGLRYLAPLLPFLFIPAAIALSRLPRSCIYLISIAAVTQAWSMAMSRDVQGGFGVLNPILHIFVGGFQLPALTVLSQMNNGQYGDWAAHGVSPFPIFAVTAAVLAVIWRRPAGRTTPQNAESTEQFSVELVCR